MQFIENIQMAAKNLNANRLRSLLTMLGIIIGNASVITMVALGEGAKQFTQDQLESFGPNQLTIFASDEDLGPNDDAAEITLADVDAIASQAPAVLEIAPQINAQLQFTYGSRSRSGSVIGTTPGIGYVRSLTLAKGRFLTSTDLEQHAPVIVLGSALEKRLFGEASALGKMVQVGDFNFQVMGVMTSKGTLFGVNYDETAYVPITTMAYQLSGRQSPNGIPIDFLEISAQDSESIRAAAFQISNILTRRHGKKNFSVWANKSFQDMVAKITAGLSLMLAAIASISLLVGGIGVMNIMLVSVTERTHEIGLRKAIGATQRVILTQFLIEAIILSVAGGVIGIGLGTSGAVMVAAFSPLKPGITVNSILLATGVSGTIGLIFGVVPARQAARLDPIVALRS
ncbi:FtsX-like permease family protein [Leptolyngbyaceae cyanobacterium CCMR0082]|uniref:FtsX-like permease family protein n=1 Tax=Adonisia turfae CCMR0082 TaxID=2304604 RepID=A0A6M0S339_9CYAN|nr:ABC transporter permease [Adonisia turfae]NEZ62700.1 FtsX-like permease family protein [Adonisia turfae CCMR0082]